VLSAAFLIPTKTKVNIDSKAKATFAVQIDEMEMIFAGGSKMLKTA